MTDLQKLRDELADKRSKRQCTTGNQDLDKAIAWYLKIGFEDGFDAGVAEMQAQIDELKKSNNEMSDLIYSEDGYIASQDELNNEIRKWSELYLRTEKYGDKVADERDSLKEQVVELKQANANCISLSLHESRIRNVEKERDTLKQALDVAVSAIKYADENCDISGLHKALTSINEIINKTKQGE